MLKLLVNNRQQGKFTVEAKAETDEATIYLYDMIVNNDEEAAWFGGISPQSFIKALVDIKASTIHLRVNSPGGSVFAARAIEQAIREHKSTIIAHIDGLAASAASFLVMAADKIHMAPGSFLMIHKAWTMMYGNADDLRKEAGLLDQVDASLVKTYAKRSNQDEAAIASWMADETWLEATKAVELGFADLITEDAPENKSAWDLSAYKRPPEAAPVQSEKAAEPASADRAALKRAALKALIPA
jgi:ATP-dependent Clp protease protease subunit